MVQDTLPVIDIVLIEGLLGQFPYEESTGIWGKNT